MTVQFDCTELNLSHLREQLQRNALALNLPFKWLQYTNRMHPIKCGVSGSFKVIKNTF